MWDPLSLFYFMWVLNINLPSARLNVNDVIRSQEEKVIIDTIVNSTELRIGI